MPITDYVGGLPSWYGANRAPAVSQHSTPSVPNLPVAAVPTPASVGELGNLTQQINNMLRLGTKTAQNARIPNEPGLETQSSKVIGQELGGGVPDDVLKLLQQQGAEGAPGTGVNPMAAYERALGITSLGQVRAGMTDLSAAEARNPAAPTFDPTTQLLTPGQAGNLALGQQSQNLAAQAEADRVALEEERLALEGARLPGGGVGYGGQASTPAPNVLSPGPAYNSGQAYFAATPGYGFTPSTAGPDYQTGENVQPSYSGDPTYDELFA